MLCELKYGTEDAVVGVLSFVLVCQSLACVVVTTLVECEAYDVTDYEDNITSRSDTASCYCCILFTELQFQL
jgi:hypothetical protein